MKIPRLWSALLLLALPANAAPQTPDPTNPLDTGRIDLPANNKIESGPNAQTQYKDQFDEAWKWWSTLLTEEFLPPRVREEDMGAVPQGPDQDDLVVTRYTTPKATLQIIDARSITITVQVRDRSQYKTPYYPINTKEDDGWSVERLLNSAQRPPRPLVPSTPMPPIDNQADLENFVQAVFRDAFRYDFGHENQLNPTRIETHHFIKPGSGFGTLKLKHGPAIGWFLNGTITWWSDGNIVVFGVRKLIQPVPNKLGNKGRPYAFGLPFDDKRKFTRFPTSDIDFDAILKATYQDESLRENFSWLQPQEPYKIARYPIPMTIRNSNGSTIPLMQNGMQGFFYLGSEVHNGPDIDWKLGSIGEKQYGLQLETFILKSVYSPGEPIEVMQLSRNVAESFGAATPTIRLGANPENPLFKVKVEDPTPGHPPIPLKKRSETKYNPSLSELKKNEALPNWDFANRDFDFPATPGDYTLTGTFDFYDGDMPEAGKATITSKPIKFRIEDRYIPPPAQIEAAPMPVDRATLEVSPSFKRSPLGLNDPITIKLTSGPQTGFSSPTLGIRAKLQDDKGQTIPLSKYGARFLEQGTALLPAIDLQANQLFTTTFLPSQWFNLPKAGNYTLTLTLIGKTTDRSTPLTLTSNSLTFQFDPEAQTRHQLLFQ